jgi:hypothetical protein
MEGIHGKVEITGDDFIFFLYDSLLSLPMVGLFWLHAPPPLCCKLDGQAELFKASLQPKAQHHLQVKPWSGDVEIIGDDFTMFLYEEDPGD